MNLPNKLTVVRLFAAPLFFVIYLLDLWTEGVVSFQYTIPVLWIILIVSEVTDALDGYYARKLNLVSDMGKLLDPFSDVFLRVTYFICFWVSGLMPVLALMVIVWRELGIQLVRLLMVKEGITLAARKGGKLKAIMYFISGVFGLAVMTVQAYWNPDWSPVLVTIAQVLFYISAVASLASFVDYLRLFFKTKVFQDFLHE